MGRHVAIKPAYIPRIGLIGAFMLAQTAAAEDRLHRIDIGAPGDERVIVDGPSQREGPRPQSRHWFFRECSMRWFPNRWTLELPVFPECHNRLRFRGKGRGFRARIDARHTYMVYAPGPPLYETEFIIPASVINGRQTIRVEGTAKPPYNVPPGARDTREMALAVDWITIAPVATLEDSIMSAQQLPPDVEPDLPLTHRLRGTEMRPLVTDVESYAEQARLMRCNVMTIGPMNGRHFCAFKSERGMPAPNMEPDFIPRQVDALHEHGIAAIGWLPFNVQDLRKPEQCEAAKAYPDYRMKSIDWEERSGEGRVGMCVMSSPWRDIHADILKEAASQGIDGVFFDGFYLGSIPHPIAPGCVCEWCRKAFKDATHLDAPERVDWTDSAFKRWVRWRNHVLIDTAIAFRDKMREANPDLMVTCNYNVWPFGSKDWETGIPLWATDEVGTSQHAYSGRADLEWVMLGFKSRLSHDLSPAHSDIWRTSRPAFKYEGTDEDNARHELTMRTFMLSGLTYGVTPWHGGHIGPPPVGIRVHQAVKKREHLFSQDEFRHIGVLLSQNTHDFYGHIPGTDNLEAYRDTILGAWLLLTEHHLPFRFVFDNQLNTDDLADYHVLYLPNTACLADETVEALDAFAKRGGLIVATGNSGDFDGWGERRERNALDAVKPITRLADCPALEWLRTRDAGAEQTLIGALKKPGLPYVVEAPRSLVLVPTWAPGRKSLWIHMLNVSAFYPGGDTGFRGMGREPVYAGDVASDANIEEGQHAIRDHVPARKVVIALDESTIEAVRLAGNPAELTWTDGRIVIPEVDVQETLVLDLLTE